MGLWNGLAISSLTPEFGGLSPVTFLSLPVSNPRGPGRDATQILEAMGAVGRKFFNLEQSPPSGSLHFAQV